YPPSRSTQRCRTYPPAAFLKTCCPLPLKPFQLTNKPNEFLKSSFHAMLLGEEAPMSASQRVEDGRMTNSTLISRLMGPILLFMGIGAAIGLLAYVGVLREINNQSATIILGMFALLAPQVSLSSISPKLQQAERLTDARPVGDLGVSLCPPDIGLPP